MSELKRYTTLLKENAADLRILYVEDDDDVRAGITSLLEKFFKEVVTAQDGLQGLEAFNNGRFDLILSDISMPNMNGVEMVTAIKQKDYEQTVCMLSAHNEDGYLFDLINVGVDAFLLKPIQTEQMVKVMNRLTSHINDAKMAHAFQEVIESNNIELLEQKEELERQLKQLLQAENSSIMLAEAHKEEKDIPKETVEYVTKEFDAVSAIDFIENYPIDITIYGDQLLDIGEQLDLLVNGFINAPSQQSALALSQSFHLYADVISKVPEFVNLTYALSRLAEVFENINLEQSVELYRDLILAISQELERWRSSIFEDQSAENIHYLDNSLISDCLMLESFVNSSVETSDDSEDDLGDIFF